MSLGPLMIDLAGPELSGEEERWLREPAVGGVILFSRNFRDFDQLRRLTRAIRALRTPGLLIAVDQEGGRVQRFKDPFTRLPPMRTLGHQYDLDRARALASARRMGWLMAAELRAVDIDLSFAPVVDLDRGLADVIGDRAFHDDAEAVARLACEFAAGAKQAGMAVVAKHFPTHAGAVADSHTSLAVDARSYAELLDDLIPYRRLIAHGLLGVMAAHVSFPAVDPLPASFSSWWLKGQLRGELGFGGAVLSDDLAMAGAGIGGSCADRAVVALGAGCDMVLLCNRPDEIPATIERLNRVSSPPSQLHLVRLRGQQPAAWDALRASPAWQEAYQAVAALVEKPSLKLEG
ncbi:MAG TPA: beta-N-acetylhexosaminidase [Gammaproteobacteria bacterium]|nr:beta-N-acetylhexosaminidase [Gammaproteobacteria bacterium]